jgi:hypothetical protein
MYLCFSLYHHHIHLITTITHHLYHMDSTPIHKFFAPKGEFFEPLQLSKPITTSGFELCSGFIAMVRDQSFSRQEDGNPYTHIQKFEELCSCLHISDMTHESMNFHYPFREEQNNGMLIPLEVFMEIGMNFETNFVLLSSLFLKLLPFE